MAREKWYRVGLRFECTRCGQCCSGAPGYVWVTRSDIARIARFLGREDGRLDKGTIRRVGLRYSLTERSNGDCVFLARENDTIRCLVHPVRPLQCRTWPFWTSNLRSSDAWNEAHRSTCPGINSGKHYDLAHIERLRKARTCEDAVI